MGDVGAWRYGGRLLIVPRDVARSADDFHQLTCMAGVTVLNQTPSAFRGFIEASGRAGLKSALRYVIFGGEALEPAMLKAWYAHHPDSSPQLVNMYGITETTVHVTFHALEEASCAQGESHRQTDFRSAHLSIGPARSTRTPGGGRRDLCRRSRCGARLSQPP